MNQFLEAAAIALSSIWANKLRSFLTVLGNIVAVTSIIAVVSLIQGMNAYVTNAIVSDVGADNFTIQRHAASSATEEDEERVRSNPRDHARRRRGASSASATRIARRGGAGAARARAVTYGNESLESVRSRASRASYLDFPTYNAERGRLISPSEIDAEPPGHRRSAGRRPTGCSARPIPSTRSSRSAACTSASSASARRRDRSSASRRTSSRSSRSGVFQKMFGVAPEPRS